MPFFLSWLSSLEIINELRGCTGAPSPETVDDLSVIGMRLQLLKLAAPPGVRLRYAEAQRLLQELTGGSTSPRKQPTVAPRQSASQQQKPVGRDSVPATVSSPPNNRNTVSRDISVPASPPSNRNTAKPPAKSSTSPRKHYHNDTPRAMEVSIRHGTDLGEGREYAVVLVCGNHEFRTGFMKGSCPTWGAAFQVPPIRPLSEAVKIVLVAQPAGMKKKLLGSVNERTSTTLQIPAQDVAHAQSEGPCKFSYSVAANAGWSGSLTVAIAPTRTSLYDAMVLRLDGELETLFNDSAEVLRIHGAHRWTLLMRVLWELPDSTISDYVPRLIRANVNVTAVNDEGKNALFMAVASSKRIGTRLMLDALQNAAAKLSVDSFGNSKQHSNTKDKPFVLIFQLRVFLAPLHFCTDETIATSLIAAGFSTSTQNKAGNTALHYACAANLSPSILQALATKKKLVNANGHTAQECKGLGMSRAIPFSETDAELRATGGLVINDAMIQNGGIGYW
jgi:ankyrin repeat protein